MVEELKAEMRKLENLIGFEGKVDVTSRAFTQELIRALESKYKDDVKNSLRLHQLEFYHDLIESARHKQRKSGEVEEKFLLEEKKKKEDDDDDEEVEEQVKEKELFKKPEEVVAIKAENVDEWKDLMTLSRIYYVLEHPNSTGLTWKRRIFKKKSISKFSDKDLIEWRVAENFKLRGLEEWALSRSEARKVAEKSPYDFDDLLEDDESRELEDMFNILDTQKQKKRKVGQLEKSLKSNRPFKFKDEGVEDWTESYSDDSEESGMEDMAEEILEMDEEPDFKVDDYKVSSEEQSINEEEAISEIFSVYEEKPKFRNPVFEEMDKAETMERWFDLCHDAVGVPAATTPERPAATTPERPAATTPERPPAPQILFTVEEGEEEDYLEEEIPDDIGYVRGQEVAVEEAKEKDIERPGGRIPAKEAKEKDFEKPGDDSEEPPILAPYKGEEMHIKEAAEKDIERLGGRIPVKEAEEKDIEKVEGRVPEPDSKKIDLGKANLHKEENTGLTLKESKDKDGEKLPEEIPVKEAKEKDIEPKVDFDKEPSIDSIDKLFDDMETFSEDFESPDVEESDRINQKAHDYDSLEISERKISNEHEESSDHTPDMDQMKNKDLSKEQVTSSETGSISKHDEEVTEEHIKKIAKEAKDYALSDAKNEAVLTRSRKISSSERQLTKQKTTPSSEKQASKEKFATPSKTQAVKKKSFTTPETTATKKKSSISVETQATKTKSSSATPEIPATKKKSFTTPEVPATTKKSVVSSERPVTKKKSATSSKKLATEKKSETLSKRQSTNQDVSKTVNKDEQPSSYGTGDLESLLRKESNTSNFESDPSERKEKPESSKTKINQEAAQEDIRRMLKEAQSSASSKLLQDAKIVKQINSGSDSLGEFDLDDTYGRKASKKPSTHQATISMQDEQRVGERLKSIIEDGKVDALEEKDKEYKKRRATLSSDDFDAQNTDLESILKSDSNLNVAKSDNFQNEETVLRSGSSIGSDSLGEIDLDDMHSRKESENPSFLHATISMQDEQHVGQRLKSIIEEGKVDALEEKEKEYKKRRATLSPDSSDAKGSDLESILKSQSRLNLTKSGEVKDEISSEVDEFEAQTGTLSLGQEDKLEKVVKSTADEAKKIALRRQDSGSNEKSKKGSRSFFRKS